MATIRSLIHRTSAVALLAATAAALPAHALTIQVGSYTNTGIGAEFATPYDSFTFGGGSATVAATPTPTLVGLGQYSFDVGWNCNSCNLTPSFDALIDVTVDGVTQQLDLPYAWYSNGPSDFLSVATPAPLLFDFGNAGTVTVAFDSIGLLSSSIGTVQGNVNAMVSASPVPEPETFALLLAGFAAIGFVARRRR
jgi:hypothetical protein